MVDVRRILLSDPVKGALFFAFVAPPVGAIMLLPLFIVVSIAAKSPLLAGAFGLLMVTIIPVFSYFLGMIPAAITGFIAGFFRKRLATWAGTLGAGALGFVVMASIIVSRLYEGETPMDLAGTRYEAVVPLGVCAFVGAAVAGRLFGTRAIRRSRDHGCTESPH